MEDLKHLGIISITKFNAKVEDYKMIKAICLNNEVMKQLINDGLKLMYYKYKVEKYLKPIKPLHCFNCQQFFHFAVKCPNKDPICVKCGDRHKVKYCIATEVKCHNCKGDHTSSYGGCEIYQKNLNEKMEKIKVKNSNVNVVRQFSQVVKSNNENENILINLSATIENMNKKLDQIESNLVAIIDSKIDSLKLEFTESINELKGGFDKQVKEHIEKSVQKQIYYVIDMFNILLPNLKPTNNQIEAIANSLSRHQLAILNKQNYSSYIDKTYGQR